MSDLDLGSFNAEPQHGAPRRRSSLRSVFWLGVCLLTAADPELLAISPLGERLGMLMLALRNIVASVTTTLLVVVGLELVGFERPAAAGCALLLAFSFLFLDVEQLDNIWTYLGAKQAARISAQADAEEAADE